MDEPTPVAAERRSRITEGTRLLHGDLHNHTLLSDGAGDPRRAFALMRAAGLDVAALTDHASIPLDDVAKVDRRHYPHDHAYRVALMPPSSIDAAGFALAADIADDADVPGEFTAIRGFEWTEPWLGHANVWFSGDVRHVHTPGRVGGLHEWLATAEPDALFGYNHPGREPGRFGDFALAPKLVPRMVAVEAFNRHDDYLFEGWRRGQPSPLVACLEAGWRPGVVGVSDEHGRSYGLAGKGRTGIWAREHSRAGVREALLARRTYATREAGLRLDATLDGARMGGTLGGAGTGAGPSAGGAGAVVEGVGTGVAPAGAAADGSRTTHAPNEAGARPAHGHRPGGGTAPSAGAELVVDIDGGPAWRGRMLDLQLLAPGSGGAPAVLAVVPARAGQVARATIDVTGAPWIMLRIADPQGRNGTAGPEGHPANAYGVAYASPWHLRA